MPPWVAAVVATWAIPGVLQAARDEAERRLLGRNRPDMFRDDIVFVVGAGASKELNFPIGSELAAQIIDNLEVVGDRHDRRLNDRSCHGKLQEKGGEVVQKLLAAAGMISRGLLHAQSIDAFIDMHSNNQDVATLGKLQIAMSILRIEASSDLFVDDSNIHNRVDFSRKFAASCWLRPFTEMLLEKSHASDTSNLGQNITLICFNYDRCIEQYLAAAIENTLAVRSEVAHEIVGRMNIIHPYGSIGKLPPRGSGPGPGVVPFGAKHSVDHWSIARNLSTFTEEMTDTESLGKIHDAVLRARQILFLGFSFQPQNMRLLTPTTPITNRRVIRCYSTGIGFHELAHEALNNRVLSLLGENRSIGSSRILQGLGCAEMLRAIRPMLTT